MNRKISSLLITIKALWLITPARRIVLWFLISVPIFLTIAIVLPVNIVGPFNAETYGLVNDVRIGYSPMGAAVEPVTALAQIISGAPDIGVAAISISIWIIGIAACVTIVRRLRENHWQPNFRVAAAGLKTMLFAAFVLIVYGVFSLLVRIPNWRLTTQNPDIVVAELHTHTFDSHDGLISARDNLRWQAQRGCSVVGIVEHHSAKGSLYAATVAETDLSLPAVLPGVEVGTADFGYITAYAIDGQMAKCVDVKHWNSFIPRFHQNCQGVMLSMTAPNLTLKRLKKITDLGIDGFEIANQGHPSSPTIRKAVLAVADNHHLPLIAVTDWHGFGGILRAWTVFRIPHADSLSRTERVSAVFETLRRHDRADVTPVVIGRMGKMSSIEIIFAPFVEVMRYALALSPLRVLAWWFWDVALFLIVSGLFYLGIHPGRMISAAALILMGIAVSVEALRLIIAYINGQAAYVFPFLTGVETLGVGIAAIICGLNISRHSFSWRRHRMKPPHLYH